MSQKPLQRSQSLNPAGYATPNYPQNFAPNYASNYANSAPNYAPPPGTQAPMPAYPVPAYPVPAYPLPPYVEYMSQPSHPPHNYAYPPATIPKHNYAPQGYAYPPPTAPHHANGPPPPQNVNHVNVQIAVNHHHHDPHFPPDMEFVTMPLCPNHNGEMEMPRVFTHCHRCGRGYCEYCLRKQKDHTYLCVPCRTKSASSFLGL